MNQNFQTRHIPKHPYTKEIFFAFLGCFFCGIAYQFLGSVFYNILSVTGGALLLLPLLMNFRKANFWALKSFEFRLAIFSIGYTVVLSTMKYFSDGEDIMLLGDLYQFSLAMLFFLVGFSFRISVLEDSLIPTFYAISLSLFGIILSYSNIGGFEILDQYAVAGKNATCVAWAIASSILFWNFFFLKKSAPIRILCMLGVILGLLAILIARGRTAFLAAIFFFVIVLYKKFGKGRVLYILAFTFVLGVFTAVYLTIFGIPEIVHLSFLQNKNEDDLNSITSGRIELMSLALESISEHPFWGVGDRLYIETGGTLIHNYPLRVIAEKGILGAAGYIVFYIFMLKEIYSAFFSKKETFYADIGKLILIIPLVASLGEPTWPFGPGTVSSLAFLIWGSSVREKYELKITHK